MNRKKRFRISIYAILFLTVAFATSVSATSHLQENGLTAFHRSGQTFLTWREDAGVGGEGYHVYRHTAPITEANLGEARLLTGAWGPLPEGSSIFYTDRDREPGDSTADYANMQNYIITDLGTQLDDSTGLFVWTTKERGDFYYAVTLVQGGSENLYAALTEPVAENVADPAPVLVWENAGGTGRVYTQFMDFETFNPTFERPIIGYGGLQYAYNYFVGVPSPEQCGGSLPASMPVDLHIEGYGSRYEVHDTAPFFCALEIWNDDPRQSWYYGFSAIYDYRTDDAESIRADSGPIVNYSEERLLRSIYDTLRSPAYSSYNLDPQRVYVYGHSMGGSGALALAMRYPNVFAASFSSEPMTNYATSNVFNDSDIAPKWGTQAMNLPIENRGRYAAHLAAYNGTGVWDWQNHQMQLVNRRGDEMAFITLYHGASDDVIEWATQGQPGYAPFYQGNRAFSGAVIDSDHTWNGFEGMGPNLTRDEGPFYNFQVLRDESVPAFSNASGSSAMPPAGAGAAYNLSLEWSSSWHNWAGAPLDTAEAWRISLRTTDGTDQTVDVTPRRLQNFTIIPGVSYSWENRLVSDNSLAANGTVTADEDGLITIPNFAVSSGGNHLLIFSDGVSPVELPPPDSSGGETQPEAESLSPAGEDTSAPGTTEPGALAVGVIDDFESGPPSGSTGWEAFSDDAAPTTTSSCNVDSSMAKTGTSSLRIDFHVAPESWASCALFFDAAQDFSAARGISFDYHAGASALLFNLDAHGGPPDARSTYYHAFETEPESVDGWVHIELTWDQVVRVDWEESPGSPVNPAEIAGFSIGFDAPSGVPNSGTIWIDNLALLKETGQLETPAAEGAAAAPSGNEAVPAASNEEPGGIRGIYPCAMPLPVGLLALILARKRRRLREEFYHEE